MKIAIVGTGVAGLVTAHLLHPEHDITVFEADRRVGGHAHTVDVEIGGRDYAVDTGFIVYNEPNYPRFGALLRRLGVATQPTEMSFGVSNRTSGLEYRASNLNSLFAQRSNAWRPSYVRFLVEIVRFNRALRALIEHNEPGDETLRGFIARLGFSEALQRDFVVPFGSAIWSADPATFTTMPALAYARFMANHGLLQLGRRPQWRTVTGGSRRYVDALTAPFAHRIRLATPVRKIVTPIGATAGVEVLTEHGPEYFDRVVVATHSDQALRMLSDPTPAERSVLGALRYQRNDATLHTDGRLLPANPRAHASWNFAVEAGARRATVTYSMNRLQALDCREPVLVTLNRRAAIADAHVLAEFEYDHPVLDDAAFAAQRRRPEIQGRRGVYFAGAYWGYGFHEDGTQSAYDVVDAIRESQP